MSDGKSNFKSVISMGDIPIEGSPRSRIRLEAPPQPPNFPPPSIPANKRLSLSSTSSSRRPLRSSPLAGPSVSSEGVVIATDEGTVKARPSRIPSTPDPYSSALSAYRSSRPPNIDLSGHRLLPSSKSAPSSPLSSLGASPSEPPATHSRRPKSRDSPVSDSGHILPSPPTFPRALSRDPNENWMTANPYASTPRFSRLSLAAPGVVLPISARSSAGKRMSLGVDVRLQERSASSPALQSKTANAEEDYFTCPYQSPSLPSLSRSWTRSDSSSSKEAHNQSAEAGASLERSSSIASSDVAIILGEEGMPPLVEQPCIIRRDRSGSTSTAGSGKPRKRSLSSIALGKRSGSKSNLRKNKHTKGLSFLSFSSDDTHESDVHAFNVVVDPPPEIEANPFTDVQGTDSDVPPLSFSSRRSSRRASNKAQTLLGLDYTSTSLKKAQNLLGLDSPSSPARTKPPSPTSTVRKLWRSLSNVGRRQSVIS